MGTLWQDIRFSVRTLGRTPGITLVMVATLALGIGASTAIFTMVAGVLLRPLPYAEGNELVRLQQAAPLGDVEDAGVSVRELSEYRARSRTLEDLVEYHSLWFSLLDRGEPERVQSGVVSWDFFEVMGVQPLLGRTFTAEEDRVGAAPVLVLGHDFWQSHFGGDPSVVGRTVEMNDQMHTIVGVLPPLPQYPDDNDVWMPWYACPFRSGEAWSENRRVRALTVLGRVRDGVPVEHAYREVAGLGEQMAADHPDAYPAGAGFTAGLVPLREELTRDARQPFLVLLAMAGLVLVIACANVANLSLVRFTRREQELAVRSAVGASRGRLARQLLTESVVLSLTGGVLGVAVAAGLHGLLVDFSAQLTPRAGEVRLDGNVLLFALAVAIATGLAVGASPALFLRKDLAAALREGSGRSSTGRGGKRVRGALVVAQLAVACVLLTAAGLMLRSFANLQQVQPGFDAENVLTAQIDLDWSVHRDAERQRAFWAALLARAEELPGVESVGLANNFPLNGGVSSNPVRVEGEQVGDDEVLPPTDIGVISPGYLETLRIPVLQGRAFAGTDDAQSPRVAMVNRSMARHRWGEQSPLGRRISLDGERWATVVGVVGDVKVEGLDSEFEDQVYLPHLQTGLLGSRLVLRTRGDPAALTRQVIDAVHAVDSRQPVAFVKTMEEVRRESIAPQRLATLLLALFGVVALGITVAGILGLVSYSVGQRVQEIGIRLALGARAERVRWMVVRQGMRLVWVGLGVGLLGALALGRAIGGLLYEVDPSDPTTYAAVGAVLVVSALAASYLPARRATRVNPVDALRGE